MYGAELGGVDPDSIVAPSWQSSAAVSEPIGLVTRLSRWMPAPRRHTQYLAALAALAATLASKPARAQEPTPSTEPPLLRATSPESGVGLMTGGTYLIVGGSALIGAASYMTATQDVDTMWGLAIVGGTVLAGGGSTLVWLGSRRAKVQRSWSRQTGLEPPPEGAALLISGISLGGAGLIGIFAHELLRLGSCDYPCSRPDLGAAWLPVAGTAVGAGVGMVIAGGVLRARNRRWREQGHTIRLSPSFALAPTGAHFGVVGRF